MEKIIITVINGIANVIESPKNVTVEIRDYDIEGRSDENCLKTDDDGDKYSEMLF